MNLFEINKAIEEAINNLEVDEATGEVMNIESLDSLENDLKEKVENIGLYIKNLESDRQQLQYEIQKMENRESSLSKKIESLRQYLSNGMQYAGMEKYNSARIDISFRASEETKILDEKIIPKKYIVVKKTERIDKVAIKKAIKEGIKVKGACIEKKQNLQIK